MKKYKGTDGHTYFGCEHGMTFSYPSNGCALCQKKLVEPLATETRNISIALFGKYEIVFRKRVRDIYTVKELKKYYESL